MLVVPKEFRGYAVVIPKKIVHLSSARHLLKRRIFEAMRTMPLPPALIVFARAQANSVNYKDIETEIKNLLSKIHN